MPADTIARFAGQRVLVIGDLMLDEFLWGKVSRISPEAPVPVVRLDRRSVAMGGAANVARNLSSLAVGVDLAGFVGHDRDAEDHDRSSDADLFGSDWICGED